MPIESGIFYAPVMAPLVFHWKSQLDIAFNIGIDNYMYYVYRKGVNFPHPLFRPYPYVRRYFVVQAALQLALQRKMVRDTLLDLYGTYDYMYKLQSDCKFRKECIVDTVLNNSKFQSYPITKFNGATRKFFDPGTSHASTNYIDYHPLIIGYSFSNKTLQASFIQTLFSFQLLLFLCILCLYNPGLYGNMYTRHKLHR